MADVERAMSRRGVRREGRDLEEAFRSQATTAERIEGLLALGIPAGELARGLGVRSPSTLRNWTSAGAEPRPDTAIALDDLRLAAEILLGAGMPPERVGSWLTSRNAEWLEGARPIERIAATPMRVLAAAQETAIELAGSDSGGERLRLRLEPDGG